MKRSGFLILIVLISFISRAQTYGNEWIDYSGSRQYYYFPVYQTGIYRIDYNALVNAGINPAAIDPEDFQVFGREKELYIHVETATPGTFSAGDYIEFYAQKNDGAIDTLLYLNALDTALQLNAVDYMPDSYYSLYNDTIFYYLTWNSSLPNRRMVELTDTNYSSFTPLNWIWYTTFVKLSDQYVQGKLTVGASSSHFTMGEGWYSNNVSSLASVNYLETVLNTSNAYTGPGAPDANLSVSFAGTSHATSFTGLGNHHIQVQYGSPLTTLSDNIFIGYKLFRQSHIIPAGTLTTPNLTVRYQGVNDMGALSDYFAVGSSTLRFPHTANLGGASDAHFEVPYNISESKSRISFSNPANSSLLFYDLTDTVKRIPVSASGSNYEVLVPNQAGLTDSKCYITTTSSIINVSSLTPVNGTGYFTDYSSVNMDSAYIILTHTSLLTSAQAYAAYRSSAAGGGYNTVIVDVEELYHQYGAGIRKHIIGPRRFIDHVLSFAPVSYLFLVGKSVREATESNNGTYHGSRKSTTAFALNLVPSYGFPSSDNLITAGLASTFLQPAVPTGRIAAKNDNEVLLYLTKVQQYEALQDPNTVYDIPAKDWMKHVMHFGGGGNTDEQNLFQTYLGIYESIIEDTLFGGNVHSFFKQSSDPIDPVEYDEVMDRIEEGVSLMTFFGHATANGFDQNLDEPENWNNYEKYPFVIGNACFTGDIHQPDPVSVSEEFVLIPDEGVIGFLSSVKLGFIGPLHAYSSQFYQEISRYSYGQPLGNIIKNVVTAIMPDELGLIASENVCTQMTLHCDPAIRLNYHPAPEIVVRQQDIYFEPSVISLADDSVDVNIVLTNIGRAFSDSVLVEMHRILPDGADSIYRITRSGLFYKDTVVIRIPVLHNVATGLNIIDVYVDIPSFIPEHAEEIFNNEATSSLYIYGNGIIPVYPYEFAIIPNDTITLKASTLDPLIGTGTYRFEIDTTDLFNSPVHRYQLVTSAGGVVMADYDGWLSASTGSASPLIFSDSTVYFWRVSPDSSVYQWHESSFQYIEGQRGWGQAHHFQFENNYHQNLNYSRALRNWSWGQNFRRVSVDVWGNANNNSHYNGTLWSLDGDLQDYNGCQVQPSMHVAVLDPFSLESWGTYWCGPAGCLNTDHQFGNDNNGSACRNRVEHFFTFRQDNANTRDSLVSMVNNHIPDGYYFIIYTWRYADYSQWTPQMYSMMDAIGADSIYPGRSNEPFIILARKGDPAFTKIVIGNPVSGTTAELITLSDTIFGYDYLGTMKSSPAGPAAEWEALYWKQSSVEASSTDSARISIYGVTAAGAETLLMDTLLTPIDSILNLGGIIDADVYPYVRLRGWLRDTVFFTPAQLKRWQLLYEPVPEAAVNGSLGYYFSALNDSIGEGEDLKVAIAIENISEYDMDSLLVHYWIEDKNRVRVNVTYPLQDSLKAGEILLDTITISTQGIGGLNSIWMEVNPVPLNAPTGSSYHQKEQYHENNYAQIPFYVNTDKTNPILDVTFDGLHIINGDIVSSAPLILITLNDENPWLVLDGDEDTSVFAIYLTDPSGNQRRIYFTENGTENMRFTPATGPNDKFKIELNPDLVSDGIYALLVQASDKSGNDAGDVDYKILFEVYSKPSITHILNYPNPFSTKTHFVFTLTGSAPPDYMKIQIMTITGKIVREITKDELGPLNIGRNITDFYWDGTDMFGDQLANGVYLYRVIVKNAGQTIEHRETAADPYFVKGYGKMYLMR